jgi:hypothetical protein
MARFVTGKTFGTTETVTAALLNQAVNDAAISTDSVDNSTIEVNSNALRIKDNGVTLAKMATQADQTVLGNVSGGAAVPTAVPIVGAAGILINDDALGTSDTKGATQGNIKAYVDSKTSDPARVYNSFTNSTVSGNIQQNTTGRPLWVSFTFYTADNINFLIGEISSNSDMSSQTRIGQSRMLDTQTVDNCATQVTMIVPSQWYWRFNYSSNQAAQEIVHSSFVL